MQVLMSLLKRPVAVYAVIGSLFLLGILTAFQLPTRLFPNISRPSVLVEVKYPGSPLLVTENTITKPLEEELGTLNGLVKIRSLTTASGVTVFLFFDWKLSVDRLKLATREKLDLIRLKLPRDIEEIVVKENNQTKDPSMILHAAVKREGLTHDLSRMIQQRVKPRMEKIPEVSHVVLNGVSKEHYVLKISGARLNAFGITPTAVIAQIRAFNVKANLGAYQNKKEQIPITFESPIDSLTQLDLIWLKNAQGKKIKLSDLGPTQLEIVHERSATSIDGKPSIEISIYKNESASSLKMSNEVNIQMETYSTNQAFSLTKVYDEADFIKESIKTVTINALLGATLAIFVLWLFMQKVKETMVIAGSLPLIAFIAICGFPIFGISINIFSLVGLALAMGMVIDGAIVIVESTQKELEKGARPKEAIEETLANVSKPIIASGNTSMVVFLPIIFIPGISGIIFRDLAITIILILFTSIPIYFTFVTLAITQILHGRPLKSTADQSAENENQRFLVWLEERYHATLKLLIESHGATFAVLLTAFIASILCLFIRPGLDFFSTHDERNYKIALLYPPGTSPTTIQSKGEKLIQHVQKHQSFQHLMGRFGENESFIQVQDREEIGGFPLKVRAMFNQVEHPNYFITPLSPINKLFGGSQRADLILRMHHPDLTRLNQTAYQIVPRLSQLRGITGTQLRTGIQAPKLIFSPKLETMKTLGISKSDLKQNLVFYLGDQFITDLNLRGNNYRYVLRNNEPNSHSVYQFMEHPLVENLAASHVFLSDVVDATIRYQPTSIMHEERKRIGEVAINTQGTSIETLQTQLAEEKSLKDVTWTLSPPELNLNETFNNLLKAMGLAILLIYVILAIQFESMLYPFIILISIPLASIGIILSLKLTLFNFDIPAFIGSAILCGIVVNNAIMLIDTINKSRGSLIPKHQAIVEGAKSRLRPILMTTLTTILAALPTAIISGTGSELYQSLSIVMVGGLAVSTFLTLYIIPLIYNLVDGLTDLIDAIVLRFQMGFKK